MFNKLLLPLLFLSCNAFAALPFTTIITVTGISSTYSLPAAIANREAIQNAVNSCTDTVNGCTVRIIDKDAYISAAPETCNNSALRGVAVPSNIRVSLERSYLKVLPNACQSYSIFRFWGVHDSELRGGGTSAIIGDKMLHGYSDDGQPCSAAGPTHECGNLVSVTESQNIVISDITLTQATGDGLYIGGNNSLTNNVLVNYVKSNGNRRQGISIISGSNITVENNWFINTGSGGIQPQSVVPPGLGMDIEVDKCEQRVINLKVRYNTFGNNWGGGVKAYAPVCPNDRNITTDDVYQNVLIAHNTIKENTKTFAFSNAMNIVAEFNNISSQTGDAVVFVGAADNIFRRNTVEKAGAFGGYFASVGTSRPNVGNLLQDNIYHNFANLIWPTNTPYDQVTLDTNINSTP